MTKKLLIVASVAALLSSAVINSAIAQDIPSACDMSVEERQERAEETHWQRFRAYALQEMPSVIDDCAFGDRLKGAMDGLIGAVFDKIPSIDSLSGDFFCGFGAQDAWQMGTVVADQEGRRDYATWWNESRANAREEANAMSRSIPGQTKLEGEEEGTLNENNIFLRIGDRVRNGQAGDE